VNHGLKLVELDPKPIARAGRDLKSRLLGSLSVLERASYAHRPAPIEGPLGLALERLAARGLTSWVESPVGLPCPHCHRRGMVSVGNRIYLCVNPGCFGDEGPMPFASLLIVTACAGAKLVPLRLARRMESARRADPRALLS
jgi:hypothetical protein